MNTFVLSKKHDALHKQRGISLVEVMVALAIGSIVIALSIKPVQSTLANARANDELKELSVVITHMQSMYANRPSFAGATQETFVNNNAFPTSRVSPGTTDLVNRWGGPIEITVATIDSGMPNSAIALSYQGVPSLECAAIIPKLDEGVQVVKVNGTVVKQDRQLSDLAAVGEACQSEKKNEIVYEFGK